MLCRGRRDCGVCSLTHLSCDPPPIQLSDAHAFTTTVKAKNEFTLVATRQGRIVGFANYYMMWFANKCVCCR